jgi:hypothetical protein
MHERTGSVKTWEETHMSDAKLFDASSFNLRVLAETIAAAVVARRHDFMSWQSEGQPEIIDDQKLAEVVTDEVTKGFVSAQ